MGTLPSRPDREIHLTEGQLAARLQVSIRTVQRWRTEGGGPCYVKCGGAVRYRLQDVFSWEEQSLRKSTSERDVAGR